MAAWFGTYPWCAVIHLPRRGYSYIYALVDVAGGDVRYIGQAKNLRTRYYQHCTQWCVGLRRRSRKALWLRQQWRDKTPPAMRLLAIVPSERAVAVERAYIEDALANGVDLLNVVRRWNKADHETMLHGESGYKPRKAWPGLDWGETQYGELPY